MISLFIMSVMLQFIYDKNVKRSANDNFFIEKFIILQNHAFLHTPCKIFDIVCVYSGMYINKVEICIYIL